MRMPTIRLVVYVLFCAMAARTQTATGSIVGTATDSSGAAVATAKVMVTNASTNAKIEVITNAEGEFTAPLLPPGSYSITLSAAGFKGLDQTGGDAVSERGRSTVFSRFSRATLWGLARPAQRHYSARHPGPAPTAAARYWIANLAVDSPLPN